MEEVKQVLKLPNVIKLHQVLGEVADLHLVGGAVRDILLGKKPKDLDFATRLVPDQVIHACDVAGIRWVPIGIRRGTIAVVMDDGETFEVTTFRNPQKEDEFTRTIEEDLPARDFTINAIAISLNSTKVVDPFGGVDDLNKGVLRAVGDPEKRFREDPHRIMRMIRFGIGQGREVDRDTKLDAYKLTHLLQGVSIERIRDELIKILMTDFPSNSLREMAEMGILNLFIPELAGTVNVKQNKWHLWDVFTHIIKVVDLCPKRLEVRLAALLHDVGKPLCITEDENGRHFLKHEDISGELAWEILQRLKFPTKTVLHVCKLVHHHMRSIDGGPKSIRKTMVVLEDLFEDWLDLKKADKLGGIKGLDPIAFEKEWQEFLLKVKNEKERKQVSRFDNLEISGKHILELGVKQGPGVGKILRKLEEIVIEDPDLNQERILIKLAKDMIDD
jgi:tRNA nucleotidyltransferase (CCA-adding enzyme)